MNLPPLPEPFYITRSNGRLYEVESGADVTGRVIDAYTQDQLRQAQREAVAAAVSERGPILYTAIHALNKVKAWRDCDGNDGFPHEVREQIDAVLMAFEARQKEKPSAAPEVKS